MASNQSPPEYSRFPLSVVPKGIVPYAELFRLHMPIGSLYTYFPCLFGSMLAALLSDPITPPSQLLYLNTILLLGSFMVHGSGSTWNDIVDQAIDRGVSRTRFRPMARNAVSVPSAIAFFVLQITLGTGMVWGTLSWYCVLWSIPALVGGIIYPFGKRFTNYPQVLLGFTFSWGVLLAFSAVNTSLPCSGWPCLAVVSLYIASVSWTVLYDTIYALQDLADDLKSGVMSTAVRHSGHIKRFLGLLAGLQIFALALVGFALGLGTMYFLCTCVSTGGMLGIMIWKLKIADSRDCLWWFSKQCYLVGGLIFVGFVGEYEIKISQD